MWLYILHDKCVMQSVLQLGSEQGRATMSKKGHFMPCNDKMENGVCWGGGREGVEGYRVEGEMRGLEGREKAFGVFLSGNT